MPTGEDQPRLTAEELLREQEKFKAAEAQRLQQIIEAGEKEIADEYATEVSVRDIIQEIDKALLQIAGIDLKHNLHTVLLKQQSSASPTETVTILDEYTRAINEIEPRDDIAPKVKTGLRKMVSELEERIGDLDNQQKVADTALGNPDWTKPPSQQATKDTGKVIEVLIEKDISMDYQDFYTGKVMDALIEKGQMEDKIRRDTAIHTLNEEIQTAKQFEHDERKAENDLLKAKTDLANKVVMRFGGEPYLIVQIANFHDIIQYLFCYPFGDGPSPTKLEKKIADLLMCGRRYCPIQQHDEITAHYMGRVNGQIESALPRTGRISKERKYLNQMKDLLGWPEIEATGKAYDELKTKQKALQNAKIGETKERLAEIVKFWKITEKDLDDDRKGGASNMRWLQSDR